MTQLIRSGDAVAVHYTGRLADGTIFDTSGGRDPFRFTIGNGEVIPGFEEAVLTMRPGEVRTVEIPPTKAFGPRRSDGTVVLPRKLFAPDFDPKVGQRVQVRQRGDQKMLVRIVEVTDSAILVDNNHPLAGRSLIFDIQLLQIHREWDDEQCRQIAGQIDQIVANPSAVKVNIGCGNDYREGFVNIDGSDKLPKVDRIIDLSKRRLTELFAETSVDYILARDFIEHFYHWQGVELLGQFHQLLKFGGYLELRVPDCEQIIRSDQYTVEQKIAWIFGSQDVPRNLDEEVDAARQENPEFFCHRYGWTPARMLKELRGVGFEEIRCMKADINLVAYACR